MGVPRNYEVAPQNKIAEIHPGQKKPAASVLTTAPGFSNDTISINNGPLRRGVVPLEWLDLKALTQYVSVSRRTLTEWLLREENPLPAFRVVARCMSAARTSTAGWNRIRLKAR